MKVLATVLFLASSLWAQNWYEYKELNTTKVPLIMSTAEWQYGDLTPLDYGNVWNQQTLTDDTVAVVILPVPEVKEKTLDIRWLGCFVGIASDNEFVSDHTMKFDVRPYGTAMFGIGEKFTAQVQVIIPTKKSEPVFWQIAVDRRIF